METINQTACFYGTLPVVVVVVVVLTIFSCRILNTTHTHLPRGVGTPLVEDVAAHHTDSCQDMNSFGSTWSVCLLFWGKTLIVIMKNSIRPLAIICNNRLFSLRWLYVQNNFHASHKFLWRRWMSSFRLDLFFCL